jgi:uncharacterized membrane protein YraQ (UPF0718 family)
LSAFGLVLVGVFWFLSRYPQLISKHEHLGSILPTMAYSSEVLRAGLEAPAWKRILFGAINWLDSMKIGMSFGVALGALLHTTLHYYPLKLSRSLRLNSIKGALVGIPMGVCANCAVPTACGVTRGKGRIEVALGFLFSSPNFNPVVVTMTIVALPALMTATKYLMLALTIVVVVPAVIAWFERKSGEPEPDAEFEPVCAVDPTRPGRESFTEVVRSLGGQYAGHIWMLLKPTLTLMVLASFMASAMLELIPWQSLLSEVTPLRLALVSVISVFMPVPIALDVMFAAQLEQQGVAHSYVMLFAMTLGTFSIIPCIYLWREVSRRLALSLYGFFTVVGFVTALFF